MSDCSLQMDLRPVRYAEFTPRPVNQAGAQGEVAGRRVANGGARQRRRRGKMLCLYVYCFYVGGVVAYSSLFPSVTV